MTMKFSYDIIPLTDLKTNPGRVVRQVVDSHRPVLLSNRRRGDADLHLVAECGAATERQFRRAVAQGLADFRAGRNKSLRAVRTHFGVE